MMVVVTGRDVVAFDGICGLMSTRHRQSAETRLGLWLKFSRSPRLNAEDISVVANMVFYFSQR